MKAKVNGLALAPDETIIRKIYVIRGQKVMLDSDLAELYEVETKVMNQAVKRNLARFPEDFMFQLTREEYNALRSQIVTLEKGKGKYSKYNPNVFTEQGVAMLSGIINSDRAVSMNIAIMRAFVEIRKFALNHQGITGQLKILRKKIGQHDAQLNSIYDAIENLLDDKIDKGSKQDGWSNRKRIGFKTG